MYALQVIDEDDGDEDNDDGDNEPVANGDDADAVAEETENVETNAQQLNGLLNESIILLRSVKPKFHYADFPETEWNLG